MKDIGITVDVEGILQWVERLTGAGAATYERYKKFDRLIVDSGDPDELAARLGIDRSQITITGVDQPPK